MAGNLAAWLIDGGTANGGGSRVALREGDRAWTFAELATQVARTSSALRGLKLGRGERVLILMRDTLEAAVAFYHRVLTDHPSGQQALDYLRGRGFTDQTIETFQLGWAPDSWDAPSAARVIRFAMASA